MAWKDVPLTPPKSNNGNDNHSALSAHCVQCSISRDLRVAMGTGYSLSAFYE